MEIQGTVKRVQATQQVSDKYSKREIHIEVPGLYPQTLSIEFAQDQCSLLDSIAPGQQVKIGINLRGREWTSPQGELRVFNTIQGWKIEAMGPAVATTDNSPF
jgi:translation initiation factor IF-3